MILGVQDAWGARRCFWMLAPTVKHVGLVLPKIAGAGHSEAPHILDRFLEVANDLIESLGFASDDGRFNNIVMDA